MSCFWRDLRGTFQTCREPPSSGFTYPLGNYVALFDDEVPITYVRQYEKDSFAFVDEEALPLNPEMVYTKHRKLYFVTSDFETGQALLWRYDGGGAVAPIPGAFAGFLGFKNSQVSPRLRFIEYDLVEPLFRVLESEDGESWSPVSGTDWMDAEAFGFPVGYAVFGSRLILRSDGPIPPYYSDDGGETWSPGSGGVWGALPNRVFFMTSGPNIICVNGDIAGVYVSSDGAAWSQKDALFATSYRSEASDPPIAVDGIGAVVVLGEWDGAHKIMVSMDHGATWVTQTVEEWGFPANTVPLSVVWDGVRFVLFCDAGFFQVIHTFSPPAAPSAPVAISNNRMLTQVID